MTKMKPGNFCPLIKKDCIGIKCSWYTQMRGTNPNTGEPVEIAQKSNQTGAAVESFRNEVVKGNQQNQQLYIQSLQQGIVPTQITPLNQPINILLEGEK